MLSILMMRPEEGTGVIVAVSPTSGGGCAMDERPIMKSLMIAVLRRRAGCP